MRATAIGLAVVAIAITIAWTALNASANTSGPDPSGYSWTDSNSPSPFITPNFVDISATGTLIDKITDFTDADDGVWTQPLPFDFGFFGNTYDTVQISTNGFISFTIPGPQISDNCNENYNYDGTVNDPDLGNPIPHDDADCENDFWAFNPLIAGFFDDLDPGECGEVYYGTNGSAPNRMFIVQWDDVCHNYCDVCAAGSGITFEIILYEGSSVGPPAVAGTPTTDGNIRIQYADGFFEATTPLVNNGASATSGLSFDGSTGLQYSYIQQSLTGGRAVLYSPASETTATPTASPTETETPTPSATPTPTSTPAGQTVSWGDANCSDAPPDPIDSLLTLRHDAGLSANTGDCPALGTTIDVTFASLHVWGDVDCSGEVTPVDSLKILRSDAGLGVTQEADCPEMGQQVQITPQ